MRATRKSAGLVRATFALGEIALQWLEPPAKTARPTFDTR